MDTSLVLILVLCAACCTGGGACFANWWNNWKNALHDAKRPTSTNAEGEGK